MCTQTAALITITVMRTAGGPTIDQKGACP